jgi:Uma2 family endonuclease
MSLFSKELCRYLRPPTAVSRVIEEAPLLCLEVVSPDDRIHDITSRAEDYIQLGVPETWIFDPETQKVYVYSTAGLHEVPGGTPPPHSPKPRGSKHD